MAELAAIYLRLIGARLREQAQFRLSFAMEIVGAFWLTIIDFFAVAVFFAHVPLLGTWTFAEMAFLYGTSNLIFRFTDCIAGHLDSMPEFIQTGRFDQILTRPLGSLFQLLASDVQVRHLGSVAQGVVILAIAISQAAIDWNVAKIAIFAAMTVSGVAIFMSIWVIGAVSVFWTVRSMEAVNAFTYGGNMLTTYPIDLFSAWFRRVFAFLIPLAFINYFPALYILDKTPPLQTPGLLRFASPLVALLMVLLANSIWQWGIRHYRGTGS